VLDAKLSALLAPPPDFGPVTTLNINKLISKFFPPAKHSPKLPPVLNERGERVETRGRKRKEPLVAVSARGNATAACGPKVETRGRKKKDVGSLPGLNVVEVMADDGEEVGRDGGGFDAGNSKESSRGGDAGSKVGSKAMANHGGGGGGGGGGDRGSGAAAAVDAGGTGPSATDRETARAALLHLLARGQLRSKPTWRPSEIVELITGTSDWAGGIVSSLAFGSLLQEAGMPGEKGGGAGGFRFTPEELARALKSDLGALEMQYALS
jgi:hypothetical protein